MKQTRTHHKHLIWTGHSFVLRHFVCESTRPDLSLYKAFSRTYQFFDFPMDVNRLSHHRAGVVHQLGDGFNRNAVVVQFGGVVVPQTMRMEQFDVSEYGRLVA